MSYSLVSLDTFDNIVWLNVIFNKANITQLIISVARTPKHTKLYFHYEQLIVVMDNNLLRNKHPDCHFFQFKKKT